MIWDKAGHMAIYLNGRLELEDTVTGYQIALATVTYRGSDRPMMVAFEEDPDEIVAITIHPLDERSVTLKVQSGRWKP